MVDLLYCEFYEILRFVVNVLLKFYNPNGADGETPVGKY